MILLAALALFSFFDIQPWRFSEGRQELIPALSATLTNNSGDDWAEARFRVTVACPDSSTRSYTILLRDILLGSQPVQATAFDAIGQVQPCQGQTTIEFLEGRKYPESARPSWIVFGFSYQIEDNPPSTDLAGILDYRRHSDSDQETHPHFLKDHGRRLTLPGYPNAAFYAFRVEPGPLGLAGFLLSSDPQSNPLSRFLRFFHIQPGAVSFLGIFQLRRGPGKLHSVTMEASPAPIPVLAPLFPRPVLPSSASRPATTSSLTIAR